MKAGPNALVFWHFARRFIPWLLGLVVYVIGATLLVRWDVRRDGGRPGDFAVDLYGMYMQVFFQPTLALPRSTLARVVFWVTPLLGAGLLLRGLVRVGSSLFDADARKRLWVKIMIERTSNHIVVCGLGNVGIRVVESLKHLGFAVVAIERRTSDSHAGTVEDLGIPVLYGDARRDELLIEAGIRRAKAVVCATDDDLTNLEVAIDSKRENPKIRVVTRIFDQRVARKIRTALDVDETFSTSALSGPLVALQATESGVLGVYRLDDGSMRVDMELLAPTKWWGRTVADCEDAVDGRVVAIKTSGKFARPRHDTRLVEGDLLTIDVPASAVATLKAS